MLHSIIEKSTEQHNNVNNTKSKNSKNEYYIYNPENEMTILVFPKEFPCHLSTCSLLIIHPLR